MTVYRFQIPDAYVLVVAAKKPMILATFSQSTGIYRTSYYVALTKRCWLKSINSPLDML